MKNLNNAFYAIYNFEHGYRLLDQILLLSRNAARLGANRELHFALIETLLLKVYYYLLIFFVGFGFHQSSSPKMTKAPSLSLWSRSGLARLMRNSLPFAL
jgi:hypothetical protein